ncbi:calmodulin binding [Forsythia ovata]|uniref:Calmodulin binding n=1 Tax=Forsythia ovata TaxID=205694 RepID=A0ABD1QCX9_9LAMI
MQTLSCQASPYSQQPHFFTASKNTPVSYSRRGLQNSALKSKTAKRLKAFELEQSNSARKVQIEKEKSLKSLARFLTVWLNFLFENPGSCGCNVAKFTEEVDGSGGGVGGAKEILVNNGKRDSLPSRGVGVDGP